MNNSDIGFFDGWDGASINPQGLLSGDRNITDSRVKRVKIAGLPGMIANTGLVTDRLQMLVLTP
jgi:hypothetical protein